MYQIVFIHSSVSGHLDYYHVLAIVNSATMNTGVHEYFEIRFYQGISPVVEKAMATHSSNLAWKIPWKEEPGRL